MATTIKSTDLDFDTIKTRLKTDLKAKSEFADYDFDAAGLSNILDVLAYNTHMNGLLANFTLNEAFLNTAQLRSSVVSHAETLGYTPRSKTSSTATLNVSVIVSDSVRPATLTLPRGTTFATTTGGTAYTFRTLKAYDGADNGQGTYSFLNENGGSGLTVHEGTEKIKTFHVGETTDLQVYVIPDVSLDTSTLFVKVFDTASSTSYETYTNLSEAVRIDSLSKHYQIKEVPNGNFEVIFGDGKATGKAPSAGNKIEISYLAATGDTANGASVFSANSTITVNSTAYTYTVVTEAASAGGAEKESIDSIRINAPIQFASQQRLVTAEDYKTQVLSRYSNLLDDVVAWGGEENIPPDFGNVYLGLKFASGTSDAVKTSTKEAIKTNLTDNLAIMTIETKFVDPVTAYLELRASFNFDPDLTSVTSRATETSVFNKINTWSTDNLNLFGKVFRRSSLLKEIDDLDVSILNSKIDVKVQRRITPTIGQSLAYTINFPSTLASPDDVSYIILSSRFTFNSKTCFIRNVLNTTKLEMVNINGDTEVDNIGNYSTTDGVVELAGFAPTAIEGSTELKISATPANQSTVRPLRNYVLTLDTDLSYATAIIDTQDTKLTL